MSTTWLTLSDSIGDHVKPARRTRHVFAYWLNTGPILKTSPTAGQIGVDWSSIRWTVTGRDTLTAAASLQRKLSDTTSFAGAIPAARRWSTDSRGAASTKIFFRMSQGKLAKRVSIEYRLFLHLRLDRSIEKVLNV